MESKECRFEEIKIDLLHSNLKYQREIDYDRVKYIATNWDLKYFDSPCISFRDGMYNVIEGQHTVAAAKMKFGGNKEIQCKVTFGLTEKEESKWFHGETNKKKKQSLETIYIARLLAGDEKLLKLIDDLKVTGLLLKINIPKGNCVIDAIKTVETIHEQLNNVDFISCFKLLKETWNGINESLHASFIKGIVKFYQTFKSEIDDIRFYKSLSKIKPDKIKTETESDVYIDDVAIKYAKVFCRYYNKGISAKNKLKISKLED